LRVLLDTNIVIDVALDRDPFFTASEQVVRLAELNRIEGYISASTFGDLYYVIRKAKGNDWTLEFLKRLATFCQVAAVDQTVITMAFASGIKDFEDAIQYSTAIANNLEAIVTRNPQDFPTGNIQIFTPTGLAQQFSVSS
jgi:predicted nucleic acid-binding protein